MTTAPHPAIEILDWDTDFFGFRIARAKATSLTASMAETLLAECESNSVRCLYFLADSADVGTIELLERTGFELKDVRLTLIQKAPALGATAAAVDIRPATAGDLDLLRRIARESHRDTRFFADKQFSRRRCGDLYDTWIQKSCTSGYADIVLVAEVEGNAAGYITCKMVGPQIGQIGLLAVAAQRRGGGTGQRLIHGALGWFVEQGASEVITITQGGNIAAVRAYERCGFLAERMQLWFHRWF
jgi:dTDP-4-amino-4,6-dideoxy-D-galactose acyltransferase